MTDRQDLIRFFSALDGGGDVVFVRPGDHTAGEAAQDAAEFLADRGHPDGVWFGWDRAGDDRAFAGGALVAPLTLWYGGEQARAEAMLVTLPEPYEWAHEEGEDAAWFTLSRALSEEERAYPDPSDEAAVRERIGVIRAEDGLRNDPPKGYWDEDEEIPPRQPLPESDLVWLDEVFANGSTKTRLQALRVAGPTSDQAVDGVLSDLGALAKGDVADELERLLRVLGNEGHTRYDEVVDALAAMRGWAARTAAAKHLKLRVGEGGVAAEATIRGWLSGKQRSESSENVPGGISALSDLLRQRTGCGEAEALRELADDERLSEGSRHTARQYLGFLESD